MTVWKNDLHMSKLTLSLLFFTTGTFSGDKSGRQALARTGEVRNISQCPLETSSVHSVWVQERFIIYEYFYH